MPAAPPATTPIADVTRALAGALVHEINGALGVILANLACAREELGARADERATLALESLDAARQGAEALRALARDLKGVWPTPDARDARDAPVDAAAALRLASTMARMATGSGVRITSDVRGAPVAPGDGGAMLAVLYDVLRSVAASVVASGARPPEVWASVGEDASGCFVLEVRGAGADAARAVLPLAAAQPREA